MAVRIGSCAKRERLFSVAERCGHGIGADRVGWLVRCGCRLYGVSDASRRREENGRSLGGGRWRQRLGIGTLHSTETADEDGIGVR